MFIVLKLRVVFNILNIITVLYYFINSTARPEIARATRRIDYSVPQCTLNLLSTKKKLDPGSTALY